MENKVKRKDTSPQNISKRKPRLRASKRIIQSSDQVDETSVTASSVKKRKKQSSKDLPKVNGASSVDIVKNTRSVQRSSTSSTTSRKSGRTGKGRTDDSSFSSSTKSPTESHLQTLTRLKEDKDTRLNNIECTINEVVKASYTINSIKVCDTKCNSSLSYVPIQKIPLDVNILKKYKLNAETSINGTRLEKPAYDHRKRYPSTHKNSNPLNSKNVSKKIKKSEPTKEMATKEFTEAVSICELEQPTTNQLSVASKHFTTSETSQTSFAPKLPIVNEKLQTKEPLQTSHDQELVLINENLPLNENLRSTRKNSNSLNFKNVSKKIKKSEPTKEMATKEFTEAVSICELEQPATNQLSVASKRFTTSETSQTSFAPKLPIVNENLQTKEPLQTSHDQELVLIKENLPLNENLRSSHAQTMLSPSKSDVPSNISDPMSQTYNSDSSNSLSEVLPPQNKSPFNIRVNVVRNNQERQVQFAKPLNPTLTSTVVRNTNFAVENYAIGDDLRSTDESDITNAVLYYYRYWFFDVEEEDLYKILGDDFLFQSAICSLSSDILISYNLKETINNDELDSQSLVMGSSSTNDNFQFTKPTLLPAKRPPTRLKSKSGTSSCSSTSSCAPSFVSKETFSSKSIEPSSAEAFVDDDDAISIYSDWSIKTSYFRTNEHSSNTKKESNEINVTVENNICNKPVVHHTSTPILTGPSTSGNRNKPVVQHTSTPILTGQSTSGNQGNLSDTSQNNFILKWIENIQPQKPKVHCDFKTIPLIFKPLCYYIFTIGRCTNNRCTRFHIINNNIKLKIATLDISQLDSAYKFAKDRVKLFVPLIGFFINAYARLNCVLQLGTMVRDIMIAENPDRFLNLKNIVAGLQQTGYTFKSSIEEIMTYYGTQDPALSDMLLSIVFEQMENLAVNWHLVQKLCHHRTSSFPIEHTLIDDLIVYCCNKQDIELSRKVVKDIILCGLIHLSTINDIFLNRFVSFLQSNHLWTEVHVLRKQAKLNNVNIVAPLANVWLGGHLQTINSQTTYGYQSQEQNRQVQNDNCNNFNTLHMNFPSTSFDATTGRNTCRDNFNFIQPPTLNFNTHNVPTQNNCDNACVDNEFNYEEPLPAFDNADTKVNSNGYFKPNEMNTGQISVFSIDNGSDTSEEDVHNPSGDNAPVDDENSWISPQENDYSEKCISENDIKKLSEIINSDKREELIIMYNKLKNTCYSKSFVVNIISFLKKKEAVSIYETISILIETLEQQNSHFAYISNAESTLYLLALSTIVLLKQMKAYDVAGALLCKFFDCLEHLLKAIWFRSMHKHSLSEVGKYLFFCEIFTRGGYLNETSQILKSSDLKLLHPLNTWKRQHIESFDSDYRNNVVDEFIHATLSKNLTIAKDVILYMIDSNTIVTELNVWRYFDELILALLNNNSLKTITQMLPNIIQGWYKRLTKANMRGLLVQLVSAKIPEKQLFTFYSKCCKQNMYDVIKGNETKIVVQTNMTIEEIFITIRYFLYKLMKKNFVIQEVKLAIKIPEKLNSQPKVLLNSDCGSEETKERILIVLATCFPTAINAETSNKLDIIIKPDQIKLCIEYCRKFNYTQQNN